MPVILHGGHAGDRELSGGQPSSAAAGIRSRGPFEPPNRADPATAGGSGSRPASRAPLPAIVPGAQPGGDGLSAAVSSTLEQIKDLYLTAEAIGEDALDKHFELVSDRQRQLIKEYFDKAVGDRPEGQNLADRSS